MGGDLIASDASGHLYKPLSYTSRGFENPIFVYLPPLCGVESRAICKPNFSIGYR